MSIWISAIGLALFVSVLLIVPLLRRTPEAVDAEEEAAQADIEVYRQQLKELERDIARGTISEEDAAQAKLEISRRLLEADTKLRATSGPSSGKQGARIFLAVVIVSVLIGGAAFLYNSIGSPDYQDMPLQLRFAEAEELRTTRISQAEAEALVEHQLQGDAETIQHVTDLETILQNRPDDLYGHQLLARFAPEIGNFPAARYAQERIIELTGEEATLEDFILLVDFMVVATNGYVSPKAEAVLVEINNRSPEHPIFKFYYGMMLAQTGRPDQAFFYWESLLEDSNVNDPWVQSILQDIDALAYYAGNDRYQVPERFFAPGPTEADIAAAQDMTADEQMQMIQGMVDGLSARLATEGGTADEWARLIGALGVLGDTDRAAAIWGEAQQLFAQVPGDLAMIRAAAVQAGVAE